MKHNFKITIILLAMFIITQLIGLAVVNWYTEKNLPYNMQPPADVTPEFSIISIVTAFAIAIAVIFLLTKLKAKWFLRIWFFVVVIIALSITLNSLFSYLTFPSTTLIAFVVALPLAFFKIFRQNLLVHNLTELMIYPGIASVFVPILNVWTIILLLVAISAYDIWAVWHTGFMQKMAKFQIEHLKIFAGFFVPYAGKKEKKKIKTLKQKYKNQKIPEKIVKKSKIRISLAILGGGDVVFPIIAAGIFLRTFNLLSALTITFFASLALLGLFIAAKKGKFYPAMPFITSGIFIGMLISWIAF